MSKQLSNLKLEEFSIVRGSDVQPANPGAKVLAYKSTNKEPDMSKTTPAPKNKTLGQKIGDAISVALGKATTTRTYTSDYNSTSTSVETIDDGQPAGSAPMEGEGAATVIVVESTTSTEKTAPAGSPAPAGETAEAVDADAITKAVVAGVSPIFKQLDAINTRLAVVEKAPTGSRAIGKAFATGVEITDNSGVKFPDFTKYLSSVSGLSAGQKLSKATISSSGWSYGLSFAEAGQFIDYIYDLSTLLKQCRTVKMPDKKYRLDKIGLGGKVLVKGTPGTDPGDTVSASGPTAVDLDASEVLAIVSVGDDTLEDNIEGEAFVQHLLKMISAAASNELEQAAMHGDTTVADTGILDRWDGWLKLAIAGGAHVIEGMADADRYWPGTAGAKGTKLIKSVPVKYRQDYRNLALILHNDLYLDYQDELSTKGYSEAWTAITGMLDVPLRSIKNVRMPMLKTDIGFTYSSTPYTDGTLVMLTDLRNLIFGMHREIRIEPFRQPRKRCTDYVLSMRAAVGIENGDAIGIYNHLKVK